MKTSRPSRRALPPQPRTHLLCLLGLKPKNFTDFGFRSIHWILQKTLVDHVLSTWWRLTAEAKLGLVEALVSG